MKIRRCSLCDYYHVDEPYANLDLAEERHINRHVRDAASRLVDDIALFSSVVPPQVKALADELRALLDDKTGFRTEELE